MAPIPVPPPPAPEPEPWPEPDTSATVAPRVLEAMGEALTSRGLDGLTLLVEALTSQLEAADHMLAITPRGWPAGLDVTQSPQPAWLGRATGTQVPGALTPSQQRAYIRDRSRWRRGTAGAIRAAVAALTPAGVRVDVIERDGSPWALTVRVTGSAISADTLAAIQREVQAQKPAGILLTFETVDGASYAHMAAEHGPTLAAYQAEFPLISDATQHVPEEGTIT